MKTCKMTRAHCEFLAEVLGDLPRSLCLNNHDDREALYAQVARVLQTCNDKFDYARFVEACIFYAEDK